jgi:hypothetical protein
VIEQPKHPLGHFEMAAFPGSKSRQSWYGWFTAPVLDRMAPSRKRALIAKLHLAEATPVLLSKRAKNSA